MNRLMRRVGPVAIRAVLWGTRRLFERWTREVEAQRQTGVIDFAAHRCMYGPYKVSKEREEAVLVVQDRLWRGAPGTAVDRLSADATSTLQPLWLVDLVRGVVDATEQAREVLGGHTCRLFAAHADLNRAAEALSYQVAIPQGVGQLDDLKRIPVEVWVDDDRNIRRIRHTTGGPGTSTTTLDLSDFGTQLPADWSRLPSRHMDQPGR